MSASQQPMTGDESTGTGDATSNQPASKENSVNKSIPVVGDVNTEPASTKDSSCSYDTSSDDDEYVDVSSAATGIGDFVIPPFKSDTATTNVTDKCANLSLNDSTKTTTTNSSEPISSSEDSSDKFHDCSNDFIDEDSQRDYEEGLTSEELEENLKQAVALKHNGNDEFKNKEYEKSIETYTKALQLCPIKSATERSILYANRAASKMMLTLKKPAIEDCNKSLEYNPAYVKALIRRAKLYEETEKLDECLDDYKKILELDPGYHEARRALIRLPPLIEARNERLKTEMLSKLKGLGNMVLKPFGLSTDNFQMQQDPATGSYSINFKQ